ncbi:MAG: hydroxymethylglutaryl-CoA reductase [Saprospiraceae bacterium]|nr:hydroxymethylglutaryl-CoA reductase [Saprospiraceae bacterium]
MANSSDSKSIQGFSKLNKRGKIKWIVENFFKDPESVMHELMSYWHRNEDQQKVLDGFSENTISNFPLPFSVAPNVVMNGKTYCVPMVTEESSVVAAASSAAKFWQDRGGVKAQIIGTEKLGQIHFYWNGDGDSLKSLIPELEKRMREDAKEHLFNMEKRGGGLKKIKLIRFPQLENYFQLLCSFETCDSMGANFINTCLESFSQTLEMYIEKSPLISDAYREIEILMSILSNYTPDCLVEVSVDCNIHELGSFGDEIDADDFALRFYKAVQIAKADVHRAVTHNKGILNGIDAVVLASGNDFRAVEACIHAYASRDGQYRSLSECTIENDRFIFSMQVPLALGTIGGLTNLHPMAKRSLELLENPDAETLMMITACTGLLQNFAALKSLVTTGIQKGHMKMHMENILSHLNATQEQRNKAREYFSDKKISYNEVRKFITS